MVALGVQGMFCRRHMASLVLNELTRATPDDVTYIKLCYFQVKGICINISLYSINQNSIAAMSMSMYMFQPLL